MFNDTPPVLGDTLFRPKNRATEAIVEDLIAKTDRRKQVIYQNQTDLICAILAMRGLPAFRVLKNDLPKNWHKAWDQVHRHLHGELIVGVTGQNTYKVVDTIPATMVVSVDTSPKAVAFPYRVQNTHTLFTSPKAVACAEQVGLINGNKAVKLALPEVALTFEHLMRDTTLPAHFMSLPALDDIAGGKGVAKDFRAVVTDAMRRALYLGFLIEDGNKESFTFAVVDNQLHLFSAFLEAQTRPFFKMYNMPLTKFSVLVADRHGNCRSFTGEPTQRLLEAKAGIITSAA